MAQMPSVSVYVGNLDEKVDERILFDHFKEIGPIVSVRVCSDAQTQKSLKYGYVNFQNPPDAETALERLNTTKLLNTYIRVNRVERDPTKRRAGRGNIVIKNLPPTVDFPGLKELFSKFGRINSINIATDEDGTARGYGHVMFETAEAAEAAVSEMDGLELNDRSIIVVLYRHDYQEEKKKQFTNLYIRNLSPKITTEILSQIFNKIGKTTSVMIRMDDQNQSKGFGFVAFENHQDAANAVAEYNGKVSDLSEGTTPTIVERFIPKSERKRNIEARRHQRMVENAKYPNLYVKNFDETVTAETLADLFRRYGETISVRVMHDPVTKLSRCFGFVSVKDHNTATRCINELGGSTILGSRPLYVAKALKKDARRQALDERLRRNRAGIDMFPQMAMNPIGQMNNMFSNPMNMRMPMGNMMGMHPMMRGPMPIAGRRPMPTTRMHQMPPQPQMIAHQPPQQGLATILAQVPPDQQQNLLGERLYTHIVQKHPNEAAKVTGMLLEMDSSEILNLLDSPDLLDSKIREALDVLARHQSGSM